MEINFLISIPEVPQYMRRSRIYEEAESNANLLAIAEVPRRHRPAAFQSFSLRPSVRLKFIGLDLKTFSTGLPLSK